jgi:hypothetical protein
VNGRANRPAADRSSANRETNRKIILFGCFGGAFVFGSIALMAAAVRAAQLWSTVATAGTLLMAVIALYSWQQMRRDPVVQQPRGDDDEDTNPEGGSGLRLPPDEPNGGSSLEFDWDGFLTGFRDYVAGSGSDSERELARQ